jgi:hypothetical protein
LVELGAAPAVDYANRRQSVRVVTGRSVEFSRFRAYRPVLLSRRRDSRGRPRIRPSCGRRSLELARDVEEDPNRRYPLAQVGRDQEISESRLRNWLAADQIETGERPGSTTAEPEDPVRSPPATSDSASGAWPSVSSRANGAVDLTAADATQ